MGVLVGWGPGVRAVWLLGSQMNISTSEFHVSSIRRHVRGGARRAVIERAVYIQSSEATVPTHRTDRQPRFRCAHVFLAWLKHRVSSRVSAGAQCCNQIFLLDTAA